MNIQAASRLSPQPAQDVGQPVTRNVDAHHELSIRVRDLNLWYGDSQALKSLNIDLYQKNVTALIGPSGCGKSTFLRCLNRMNDLIPGVRTEGLVEMDGRDINAAKMDEVALRRRVGMVFQKPNPFPKSIYENI
ncbi:MAG: ATP-binding cassette domain-containing protein, partial [Halomonas sp.]|uniref:phosphate ABC transporter ATP-binding protein n=1 Tax=Halomonas sp. TaxID=1486246 RepID=UPI003970F934